MNQLKEYRLKVLTYTGYVQYIVTADYVDMTSSNSIVFYVKNKMTTSFPHDKTIIECISEINQKASE
jgi:hypothetical protein